jgi:hypothetical protein
MLQDHGLVSPLLTPQYSYPHASRCGVPSSDMIMYIYRLQYPAHGRIFCPLEASSVVILYRGSSKCHFPVYATADSAHHEVHRGYVAV